MPTGYKIRGIEPSDLASYAASIRKLYWSWVVELGIKAKIRDLSAGLDKDGQALKPIDEYTRKHRKSAMTPSGKGSPSAPPLSPAYHKSRTQSLLSGRALTTHAEFFWRYDAFTGESWSVILTYQIDQGRDVFGLSPKSTAWVKQYALKRWEAWKKAGQPELQLATAALSSNRAKPVALPTFQPMPIDKFQAYLRGSSSAAVPFRAAPKVAPHETTGSGNNLLLGHVWGGKNRPVPGVVTLTPPTPAPITLTPPRPAAIVATVRKIASMKPASKPPTPPPPPRNTVENALNFSAAPDPKELQRVAGLIGKIHGTGTKTLIRIPVVVTKTSTVNGEFKFAPGVPIDIAIRPNGPTPGLTLLHEIGHYLEVFGIHDGTWDADRFRQSAVMKEWIAVVEKSEAFRKLTTIDNGYRILKKQKERRHTQYLLKTEEIWARAYAQYVATKSGDAVLLNQLAESRKRLSYSTYLHRQWEDDDFKPILEAMDRLFARLKWTN